MHQHEYLVERYGILRPMDEGARIQSILEAIKIAQGKTVYLLLDNTLLQVNEGSDYKALYSDFKKLHLNRQARYGCALRIPPFIITNKKVWNGGDSIFCKDPACTEVSNMRSITRFSHDWAKLMLIDEAKGIPIAESAADTSDIVNEYFHFPQTRLEYAAEILSLCWDRGDKLKEWYESVAYTPVIGV